MANIMRPLAVATVLTIVLAGCGAKGAVGSVDDIARTVTTNLGRQHTVPNPRAVQNQVKRTLHPLESVQDERQEALEAACQAKDLVKLGQANSIEEAVGEVAGMGSSPAARRKAVEDIADDLVKLNRNPNVVGGVSVTGDVICLFA